MKLRLKGDSVRLRVTRPEVEALASGGHIEERTHFGGGAVLVYRIETTAAGGPITAELDGIMLRVRLPKDAIDRWARANMLAISSDQQVGPERTLHISIEKDLECRHGESVEGAYAREDMPES